MKMLARWLSCGGPPSLSKDYSAHPARRHHQDELGLPCGDWQLSPGHTQVEVHQHCPSTHSMLSNYHRHLSLKTLSPLARSPRRPPTTSPHRYSLPGCTGTAFIWTGHSQGTGILSVTCCQTPGLLRPFCSPGSAGTHLLSLEWLIQGTHAVLQLEASGSRSTSPPATHTTPAAPCL